MRIQFLSIVIPVYNSAQMLEQLYEEISSAVSGVVPFEVIFVNDRSRDESFAVIQKIRDANPDHVTGISLLKNSGQHNAISCGLGFAKGDAIITMDDDLQHPPSEIPKLIAEYERSRCDVVYGDYPNKKHPGWRKTGSWLLRRGSKTMGEGPGRGSSFRILSKSIAEKIIQHNRTGFIFIDEIIGWYSGNVSYINVEHHPRRSGKSTYSGGKLISFYFDIIINYSAFPLKAMTWVGLISSCLTFMLGLRFIYKKLVHGSAPGFTAIIVTVLFSTSVLMLCLGIIGQYMYKLYQTRNRRPPFTVDKVV
ncbi:MAG TPA: glycosyltransferase family 2 protein [Bacteroidia bacterium]|nr:glycosyltransferase family 2 protein [Bacteroidia bacterium]